MYTGTLNIFVKYWQAYGGAKALIKSPYLHLAFLLLLITSHFWLTDKWWEQSISILPNLLGFSLGGFAMFLGFGDEKFRAILAESDGNNETSPYESLCASFVHFIVVQFLALTIALIAKSLDFWMPMPELMRQMLIWCEFFFSGLGYLLFFYSITSMLAATMAVFRTCFWYAKFQNSSKDSTR